MKFIAKNDNYEFKKKNKIDLKQTNIKYIIEKFVIFMIDIQFKF